MKPYINALLIKFFIALAVTGMLMFLTDIKPAAGLAISLTLTMVTFLAADFPFLLILGRDLTVIIDSVLAYPLFWGMTYLYTGIYLSPASLLFLTLMVAVGEWFFHIYALKDKYIEND
jgi:hypothetical protein